MAEERLEQTLRLDSAMEEQVQPIESDDPATLGISRQPATAHQHEERGAQAERLAV
jgi:hypothetical protein